MIILEFIAGGAISILLLLASIALTLYHFGADVFGFLF